MNTFFPLLKLGIRRRSRDFFIIFYTVVFPIVIIALLGYLTSTSYGKEFTSYEYYSIVIIPFCLLMGTTSVVYATADEKRTKTAYRYMIAPISKAALIWSKFFSCVIAFTICSVIVLLLSGLLFHLPVGKNFAALSLLLLCE